MAKKFKISLSLFLVVTLLISILPMSLLSVSAETTTYTAGNGAKYSVTYDPANVTVSEAVNKALVIQANNAVNQAGSAVHVTTETMYPILSATYDLQCNFGSLDSSSYFGFEDIDGKQFLLRVSHSSANNTTTLKISIDGQDYVCGTYPNRLRTRVYNIGVAEVNGSYYVTYDGIAVTGDGYSDDVKEALKLEKTFLKQALSNDTMFRFVFGANSLDKYAYFHPNIMYANGYAVKVASIYSDRNCGDGNLTAVEYLKNNANATSVTYTDGVFNFNVSNRTTIGLLSPVNVSDGFYIDLDISAGFYGYYTLANNLSKTLNPIKFTIYSTFSSQQNQIFDNHATTTNIQSGGSSFKYYQSTNAAHGPWKHYIDASNKLALNGPSTYGVSVATTLDCSALSHATNDVYFEYYASEHTNPTLKINPNIVSKNVVTLPENASDKDATQSLLNTLFADNSRYFTYDYDKLVKATELLYALNTNHDEEYKVAAKAVDDLISALPDIDIIAYQDKEAIEAARTAYEALDDNAKPFVTLLSTLEAYEAKLENCDPNCYRADDGDVYRVMYNKDYLTLGSHTNGALTIVTSDTGRNNTNSQVGVITADKNPILSTRFDAQQQFGTAGNYARFGFAADDCGDDVFTKETNNRFAIHRAEQNSTTIKYYTIINGESYECYVANNTTRARVWNVGVTEKDGSYYITIDGVAITGEGYSDQVKEALKLENHFDIDFLKNDSAVHFFMYSPSMFGNTYIRKNREVENGVIVEKADTYSDRNNSYSAITSAYAGAPSALTQDGNNNVYTFASKGTYTIAEPINPAGFLVDLDITKGGNIVTYSFSNTPNGTPLASFVIYHNGSKAYLVMKNGNQVGNQFSNYSTDAHGYWTHIIANGTSLNIKGPSNYGVDLTFNDFNFTSLLGEGKKVYLTLTLNAEGTVKIKTGNEINSVALNDNATQEELDTFYASANKYNEFDKLLKATELSLEHQATAVAEKFNADVNAIPYADYFYYSNEISALNAKLSSMTVREKNKLTTSDTLADMQEYLSAIKEVNDDNLSALRQMLLDITEEKVSDYDYHHNDKLDIRDLIRMDEANEYAKEAGVYQNLSFPVSTIYAADYGVIGDGVTDDTQAIVKAVNALKACGPGSQLIFEDGKTYLANSMPQGNTEALFELRNCKGLKIDGNGSTFIMGPRLSYAAVTNTKDCVLTEMNFDYKVSQSFKATYSDSGNYLNQYVDIIADREIVNNASGTSTMKNGDVYEAPTSNYFCVLNDTTTRFHIGITKYEMIDAQANKVRIHFANSYTYSDFNLLMDNIEKYGIICPMPEWGQVLAHGFTIQNNTDFTMSKVDILSCSSFGMYIGSNEGVLNFNDVDFVAKEGTNFTSWRDAFHVKDNRAAINWTDCEATFNYDDVFNISATALYVQDYNQQSLELTLVCKEKGGLYYPILAGDTLNVIDTATGNNCGTVTVKSVVKQADGVNVVVIDKALENFGATGETTLAYFTNRCAPNSTITNCNFSGTFRFRGPITISNTKFYNMRTWITRESDVEGPVPQNITFKNCVIESDDEATIEISSGNDINSTSTGYHVNNIRFENCTLNTEQLKIDANDANYVKLVDCTDNK